MRFGIQRVQKRIVGGRRGPKPGVTLVELVVVALILGILATIATNVFVGQTNRARIAATRDTIRELATAIGRYEIDTGTYPPSGSGDVTVSGSSITISNRTRNGNGLLYLALVHSLSGSAFTPASTSWDGPYIDFSASILENNSTLGETQILDSFGRAFQYVIADDYATSPFVGCMLFSGARPVDANPDLPANNPFFATETYYNPVSFQLYSFGTNGVTLADPYPGTESDDINNY